MGKRRFEMYEYRQIIARLRLGETIRGLVQARLASRKKIRAVRKTAIQQKLNVRFTVPTSKPAFNSSI